MKKKEHISIWEPGIIIFGSILAILSAAICMQIMGQFGTTPNTSLIGVVLVMILARIPLMFVQKFRNLERQNYVLSMASSAGFAAANCGFVAVATMFIMGRNDLIMPMAFATLIGSIISIYTIGKIFGSKIFPANSTWPMGKAVATAIEAGDKGGKKGWHLLQGLIVGAVASFFNIPAAGIGIAFIANTFAITALGMGMVLRGYSQQIFNGFDIGSSNIAQGLMIGAGIVSLVQIILVVANKRNKKQDNTDSSINYDVSSRSVANIIARSALLFVLGALVVAFITGIFYDMTLFQSILWLIFTGIACISVMILVGTSSMHSGFAPTFAIVTIFLTLGILIGFAPLPLAVMIGYLGSVGPCLADTGIGLKTGWIIRGEGKNAAYELYGRKKQIVLKQLGAIIGICMVIISGMVLIEGYVIPPMSIFYASTVTETASYNLINELMLWAIPGTILQVIFGNKSVGLMLATGLLINNAVYGIVLLSSVCLRLIIGTKHMNVRGPGLIAGDGLFGFGVNIFRAFF